MNRTKKRKLRYGFGFYLLLSTVVHVVTVSFFSVVPLPEAKTNQEVVPVQVSTRDQLSSVSAPAQVPRYLQVSSFVPTSPGEVTIAQATRLPRYMRSSPVPQAHAKRTVTPRLRIRTRPTQEFTVQDIKVSATVKEPVLRKKIEVQEKVEPSTPKTVTPEKKTAVKGKQKTMEETTKDGMMGLGMDTAEVEKERALAVSPAGIFTRSRLSKFLMKEPTKARLKLNVKSSGVVNKARILKSSGDVALDKVLKTLSKELRYMKAPKASVERITVQIPARR